jgi:hypothetical protein
VDAGDGSDGGVGMDGLRGEIRGACLSPDDGSDGGLGQRCRTGSAAGD